MIPFWTMDARAKWCGACPPLFDAQPWVRGYVALVNNKFCYMYCKSYIWGPAQPSRVGGTWDKILSILLFPREEKPTNQGGSDRENETERDRESQRESETETKRVRERDTERDREGDREGDRERERESAREWYIPPPGPGRQTCIRSYYLEKWRLLQ